MIQTTTTTQPIDQLIETSKAYDTQKADYAANPTALHWEDNGAVTIKAATLFGNTATSLTPTDWAWRQAYAKLGKTVYGKGQNKTLPADYLDAIRPDLRAHLLNDHCKNWTGGDWMIRAYQDNARAVLTDRYAAIGNTELLELIGKISSQTSAHSYLTSSSTVTPDSLNFREIWKDIQRPNTGNGNGGWGIGVAISNGEIGNRKLRGYPLIQRHSCQNSIIIDNEVTGFEFTHIGSASTKMTIIKSSMIEILPFAARMIETMIEADAQAIPDFADVLDGLAEQYGWDDQTKINVAVGTEGRDTRAGIVNGITHAAKFAPDADARFDMELLGGQILCSPDSLFARAAKLARAER